jgi:hypothetical protein
MVRLYLARIRSMQTVVWRTSKSTSTILLLPNTVGQQSVFPTDAQSLVIADRFLDAVKIIDITAILPCWHEGYKQIRDESGALVWPDGPKCTTSTPSTTPSSKYNVGVEIALNALEAAVAVADEAGCLDGADTSDSVVGGSRTATAKPIFADTPAAVGDAIDVDMQLDACSNLFAAVATAQADFDDASRLALLQANEMKALSYLGGIGGGITALVIINYALSPDQRDFELYFIVLGGLLDATTDALYLSFETFEADALRYAAIGILALPITIVALAFWAIMERSYAKQRWRFVFLPIEGTFSMISVIIGASYNWSRAWSRAWSRFLQISVWSPLKSAQMSITGNEGWTYTIWSKVTEVDSTERRDEGDGSKIRRVSIVKETKFFHGGLTQLLFAFVLFPLILLIIEIMLFIALLLGGSIFVALVAVSVAVAIAVAVLFGVLIPVLFSVMAFLRLFVLLPALWRSLADFATWFGKQAEAGCLFSAFDETRQARIKSQNFGIYTDEATVDVEHLKKSSVKYLLVEFFLESLPQISIQAINNSRQQYWSPIGIASMAISAYAVVSTLYKYGYLYLCATTRYKHEEDAPGIESSSIRVSNLAPRDNLLAEVEQRYCRCPKIWGKGSRYCSECGEQRDCMCRCPGYTGWEPKGNKGQSCDDCGSTADCDNCGGCH